MDLAVARWQKMTGRPAVHANGKTFAEIQAERVGEGDLDGQSDQDDGGRRALPDFPGKRSGGEKRHSKALKRPKGRRKPKPMAESTAAIIDRLLMAPIKITQDGRPAKITALEAIMRRLLQEEIAGNARASAILRKYQQLIRRNDEKRPQVVFAENDYSRSFAGYQPERRNG